MPAALAAPKQGTFKHFAALRFLEAAPGQVQADAINDKDRTAKVVLITEGLGNLRDKNYYTKSAVESSVEVFSGKQFYIDHPSKVEEDSRPERSVRDLGGYFSDTVLGTVKDPDTGEELSACFATLHFAESDAGTLALQQVKTALQYQKQFGGGKDVYCGISINAGGISEPGEIEGMEVNVVHEIEDAFSADIVTKPARGGKFLAILTEAEEAVPSRLGAVRVRGVILNQGGSTMKRKSALTEAERKKFKALKDKKTLTETEAAELAGYRKKIREAKAAQVERMKKALKEAEDSAAEAEDEDEEEGEKADEAEMQMDEGEGEKADEAEMQMDEGEAREARKARNLLAEGLAGLKKKIEAYMDEDGEEEGEKADEGYKTDENHASGDGDEIPEPPDDPKALLMDIKQDITKLLQLLLGSEKPEEPQDEDENVSGMKPAGPGMKYACASCGETNEVLPPKGFSMVKTSEAANKESRSALREAVERLSKRLGKKEARFVDQNKKTRALIQENISLKAKLIARSRADKAAAALKEAGIPADILSPADLVAYEPTQWASQIKIAKRAMSGTKLTEVTGATGRTPAGDGKGGDKAGAKAAKDVFDASYNAE